MRKLTLLALASAVFAVPAFAATRQEHHFKLTFSAKAPNWQTGVSFLTDRFAYKPPPTGQPADRVTQTKFVMASGTRFYPNSYPSCSKSKLETIGPSACPKGSQVGKGNAIVITGNPAIDGSSGVRLSAKIFTTKGGLLTFLEGSGQKQVLALGIKGTTLTANVPRICPTGDCTQLEAVLKTLTVQLASGKLVRTPSKCPSSHKWTNKAVYTYANGDTETETSTTPCKKR